MSAGGASAKQGELSNERAVAITLLSIDRELSAQVMRLLGEDVVNTVTRAMRELEEVAISPSTIGVAYRQAVRRLRSGTMALGDVGQHMKAVLVKAFGPERGQEMSRQVDGEILAKKPFAVFEALSPEDLANLLTEEHPQIAAVFLAHLDRGKAGKVLRYLPEQRRPEMVHRVATLDRTPPDVVQRVLDVMRTKVKNLGLTPLRSEPKAWIKAAAEILNGMGGGEKEILDVVGTRDGDIASAIRNEMFTFDDLGKLDKKSIQRVLGSIETKDLAYAMKATTAEVEANIFGNLSKRAADMVREERDNLGPTPLAEVLEAQASIINVVREAMDRGEIKASAGAEQMV
ncbi:MAG: flagellar motor switch protein FliG [Planctomycetota bacterium]